MHKQDQTYSYQATKKNFFKKKTEKNKSAALRIRESKSRDTIRNERIEKKEALNILN